MLFMDFAHCVTVKWTLVVKGKPPLTDKPARKTHKSNRRGTSSLGSFFREATSPQDDKIIFIFRIRYLFNYGFLLFPEVQKCYVFWHWARLFVYLCISFISRSPEMLCFQALCTLQDRFISVVSFWNRHHNVLNKYKYCEQTLFCLFCYT